ncbi:MAG: site-specific integrase [Actinomycetota bacterium]|nr:site-specific integrase [Actinomycetota bacterium]
MGWKATGAPTVRKQRDKWVVRIDGIDTATGRVRPRQVGTYASQRSARAAVRSGKAEQRSTERGTVSWLVRRYVAGRTDITQKSRESYEWAIPHIEAGLGAIPVSRLDREDVTEWIEGLASAGSLSRRSVQICRTVLRAALTDAVDEGIIARSPAARVALPRSVAKPPKVKDIDAWELADVSRFLESTADHRWAAGFRLGVLYGLRRSEVLALHWDALDLEMRTLRIDQSLVAVAKGAAWSDAKNERSRRRIPLDDETLRVLKRRRAEQAEERLLAGAAWRDHDLIIATRQGQLVLPRSYDRALALAIDKARVPPLTSHGLRHTAATHMVAGATDIGQLRAIADILGHSADMLMKTYAHAMPASTAAVVEGIVNRTR